MFIKTEQGNIINLNQIKAIESFSHNGVIEVSATFTESFSITIKSFSNSGSADEFKERLCERLEAIDLDDIFLKAEPNTVF